MDRRQKQFRFVDLRQGNQSSLGVGLIWKQLKLNALTPTLSHPMGEGGPGGRPLLNNQRSNAAQTLASVVTSGLTLCLAGPVLLTLMREAWFGRTELARSDRQEPEAAIAATSGLATGQEIYQRFCMACHQPNGQGLPGIFPPLSRSDYLLEDPQRAVRGLIQGQSGHMVVRGRSYSGFMPPVPLNDEQIASVLSYVLNAWGNSHSPISPVQVSQERQAPSSK
jgi:nitrite reductase (NO-forming)